MDVTISENIPLGQYSTFKIGGPAKFFCIVKNTDELKKALSFAKEKKLPVFILGGGSNVLISDTGFDGLVIKIEIKGIEINGEEVIAGAGEDWDPFVGYTVENNLFGLENLSLIPGSVGAAPVQNIGAYGTEAKDTISWVEVLDQNTLEIKKLTNVDCMFKYRDSIFKNPDNEFIVTRVAFKLHTASKPNITYKDVARYITEHNLKPEDVTNKKVREIVIDIRTNKLPNLAEYGTAGSFFKNPIIPIETHTELAKKYPELPKFPVVGDDTKVKTSAAWMLDNLCGFKGYKENNVGVYRNQALVIVNFGNATSVEIKNLAQKMSDCVKEKTGINLEREVLYI